jgi:hypothetical protein
MSLQDIQREEDHAFRPRFAFGGGAVASTSEFFRAVSGTSSQNVVQQWHGGGSTSVSYGVLTYTYSGPAPAIVKEEEYNPELVAEILAADALPPEEPSFDNVVDLLEWLNRD